MNAVVGAVYELELPLVARKPGTAPAPPLSLNDRLHWRKEHRLKRRVRRHVRNAAEHIGQCGHIRVQLHYLPGDNRTRDPNNLVATSKPAVDGLVDAGVVPDDNPTYVTELMPVIHPGPGERRLWLEVTVTA